MVRLAFGSATTISTLMCIPDAFGIIPVVANPMTWLIRMLGLWLSAFILWFLGFLSLLYFARFAGGGILLNKKGIKFWRFGKTVSWTDIKAITVETQPLFSLVFRLRTPARRLLIYEERLHSPRYPWIEGRSTNKIPQAKLVPHPIPSFQFSSEEFTSLFVHVCKESLSFVPNSLDAFVFLPRASQIHFLRSTSERGALLRKVLSVFIALGLVIFLGRKASLNFFYNKGTSKFRQENYVKAREQYRIATKIDPTFASAWDQLARSEFRLGNKESAEKDWYKALQMKPDLVEAKLGLSNIFMLKGEFDKSQRLLDQCARLSPHNCAVYLNQANLYNKKGELPKANQVLEIVDREACGDAESLSKAAKVYYDLGNYKQAQRLIEKSLQINPNNVLAQSLMHSLHPAIEAGNYGQ